MSENMKEQELSMKTMKDMLNEKTERTMVEGDSTRVYKKIYDGIKHQSVYVLNTEDSVLFQYLTVYD